VEALHFVVCGRPECRQVFFLCSTCDRGRRYCGSACTTLPGEEAQVDWGHFGKVAVGGTQRTLCCEVASHARTYDKGRTMEAPAHLSALSAQKARAHELRGRGLLRACCDKAGAFLAALAQRAEREHHAVEPENRLVARPLERQWEQKLQAARALEEEDHVAVRHARQACARHGPSATEGSRRRCAASC